MALHIKVIIPGGLLLDTAADTAVVPGSQGEFQVLPGHLPLFTAVSPGLLSLDEAGKRQVALFGTSGAGIGDEVKVMEELLKPTGAVIRGGFYCKGRTLLFNRGHPSGEELAGAREFAREMKKHAEQG